MKKRLALSLALGLAFFIGAPYAHANPSYFATGATTAAATTTPVYQTPGTATSTLTYDSYAPSTTSQKFKATALGLLTQFTGSSTTSVLHQTIEYSNDGIDWYRSFVIDANSNGTTTASITLSNDVDLTTQFASTTVNGAAGTAAIETTAFIIPAPFRFTRIVSALTGANGAIWAQLVPIKEQQ